MNQRLQTKCFIASAATHALLVLIVFVAPAFLPEKPRPAAPVMRMIDARLLDRLESRPLPAAAAPAPAAVPAPLPVEPVEPPAAAKVTPPQPVPPPPPPPAAKPVAKPVAKPTEPPKREPVKETPKPAKVEPKVLATSPKGKEAPTKKDPRKTKEPEPTSPSKSASTKPAPTKETPAKSTIKIADIKNLTSRKADEDAKAKQRAEAEERAQAAAQAAAARAALAAHQQRVAKMNSILGGISGGLSSPVDINIDAGGGPNAGAFLEYGQMMVQVYERSWLLPGTVNDSTAVVSVTVTVARNGRVLNWDIRKGSGNSGIDKSVRETLQKVMQFEPFPASFREAQRTFNIDFNLKAKRTTG